MSSSASDDPRQVTADIHARYFGAELDDQSLTPGDDARIASTRFEDWLSRSANQPQPEGASHEAHHRACPRRLRRVLELGRRHRSAARRGPPRDRRRQPAAQPRDGCRGRRRRRPGGRRAGCARRPLLRRSGDVQRAGRCRRHCRPRLRQRIRPGAWRALLPARGHVSGQHARTGDIAVGVAERRNDRPLRRSGTASTISSARTSPRPGRADGCHAAPRHPEGAHRAFGRAAAVEQCRHGS